MTARVVFAAATFAAWLVYAALTLSAVATLVGVALIGTCAATITLARTDPRRHPATLVTLSASVVALVAAQLIVLAGAR